MTIFIDPSGEPTYGIGICGRCSRKFPLAKLYPDPNTPGLMVCIDDVDEFDPYRLPAREPEDTTLPFTRPDVPLTFDVSVDVTFQALATEEWGIVLLTENDRYLQLEGIVE